MKEKNENIIENIVSKLNDLIKINEDKNKIIQNLINDNNNLKNENKKVIENLHKKLNEKFGINVLSEDKPYNKKEIDEKKMGDHKNDKDEINIIYKINKKEIKLFGKKFVENNKKNCRIIIEGKEQELEEDYNLETWKKREKIFWK